MKCNCKSYNLIDDKICDICENEYEFFLNKSNVVGVGLGYKITKGFCTCSKCIKVFVTKKIPVNQVYFKDLIPPMYKGIQTDVIGGGYFKPHSLTHRIRPVLGGYSIGPSTFRPGGTYGCMVTDAFSRFMLSNNHVLADFNRLPLGTKIVQPSLIDGGNPETDVVATLSKYVELKRVTAFRRPTNYGDCAIAKLTDKSIASPDIALIGRIRGVKDAKLNEPVKKVGKTTELTMGSVTSIDVTYEADYGSQSALFKKQIITTYLTKQGDSGAVLLDNNNYALGLTLGGTNSYTVFNSMKEVLKLLSVQIVTR